MDLYRIGIKVRAEESGAIALADFIPVFHTWIQGKRVPGGLIDVADYSHVPDGPGILLIAHEGNYAYDDSAGKRGFVYYGKRPAPGSTRELLSLACRRMLAAAALVENDAAFKGKLRFRGEQIEIFTNDRLLAPNEPATLDALKSDLDAFLKTLYADASWKMEREPDSKERFSVSVQASKPVSIAELAGRLGPV